MNDAAAVRSRVLDALRMDLVGPRPGEPRDAAYTAEVLPVAPSKWYLTGFLVPYEAPAVRRRRVGQESLSVLRNIIFLIRVRLHGYVSDFARHSGLNHGGTTWPSNAAVAAT